MNRGGIAQLAAGLLVALAIGGITYVAHRTRLARRGPADEDSGPGSRYFVRYLPNGSTHPEM